MPADGKLMAFEAEFVDVVFGSSGQVESVFLASYEPVGEDAEDEKFVVTLVNSAFIASLSWSPDDEPGKLSLVATSDKTDVTETTAEPPVDSYDDGAEKVDSDVTQTPDNEDESVERLREIMDDAIAASPRAAIVSQLSSSPGIALLRSAARNASWLTK